MMQADGSVCLTRKTFAERVEPSAVALHEVASHENNQRAAASSWEVIDIGCVPDSPDAAVISRVPDDPLLMRYRTGLIAANSEMRGVEVLYILDRAHDRQSVEHFLRDLHAAYGVAARLVVLPHPGTATAAFNAGARASRASLLVWLGAMVLPEHPSWLAQLTGHLRREAHLGIVGARLLREDQTAWSDGLDIGGDRASWDIRSVHADSSRGFAPAQPIARVSPDCVAVRRSVLESCGGLSQRYLSFDYSLADFCLAAAAGGFKTGLTSEPTLFLLDPPGHERQGADALDPRMEIDRRLLERRWRSHRPERLHGSRSSRILEGAQPADATPADARAS